LNINSRRKEVAVVLKHPNPEKKKGEGVIRDRKERSKWSEKKLLLKGSFHKRKNLNLLKRRGPVRVTPFQKSIRSGGKKGGRAFR